MHVEECESNCGDCFTCDIADQFGERLVLPSLRSLNVKTTMKLSDNNFIFYLLYFSYLGIEDSP